MMGAFKIKVRLFFKKLYRFFKPFFWVISVWILITEYTCVRVNVSQSLPQKYWVGIRKIPVHKGSYVLVQKPFWQSSMLKQVTGVAGDHVTPLEGDMMGINGHPICKVQQREDLNLKPFDAQIIPQGYVFVSTPSDEGIDSRYKNPGLIDIRDCQAVMFPLPFQQSSDAK